MPIINNLLIFSPTLQDALIDKNGLPLTAGVITCYADNSRTTLKNWYYQTGSPGNYNYNTLPNPMILSAAGTIQDINGVDVIPGFYPYSENDSEINEPYYITVDNYNGQRQFTRANFPFLPTQTVSPLSVPTYQNYIINNVFWRNVGTIDVTTLTKSNPYFYAPLIIYYETLAPSQHDGFMIPDFTYCKDANGADETISFEKFPIQNEEVLVGNVTPEYYCKLSCVTAGSETIKFFMFPISLHVQNMALSPFIATVQARVTNGIPTTMILGVYQSTGTGGNLGGILTSESFVLGSEWNQFELSSVFPPLEVNVGAGGDDGFYLLIILPSAQILEINFAMPSLYLGNQAATNSFQTYDMVDAIANSPRTGDIRSSINTFYPYGWVPMNDGTIGNSPDDVGVSKATARNNADTWPLYNLLWQYAKPFDTGAQFNPICQMYTNALLPVTTNYGTNAYNDFINNKLLALTPMFGKVLAGNVPITALLPNVYSQTFTATNVMQTFTATATSIIITVPAITGLINGMMITVSSTGTLPVPLQTSTAYYIQNISGNTFNLSTSQNGESITYSTSGSGTHSLNTALTINVQAGTSYYVGEPITVTTTTTLPGNLTANTIYYVTNIASNTINLCTTYNNALAGFPVINYVNAGTGVQTILSQVSGISIGEYFHRLTIGEMPSHNHESSDNNGFLTSTDGNEGQLQAAPSPSINVVLNTANTGGNVPHNTIQPSVFYNVYIKL